MMKRVDKVKRVAAISVIALMISLTGCGKSKDSGKEVTTKQENNEVTSNQGESVSGENDEAINELLNNIEVNGKHIDFPFTLNDLGDDFEFDNYVDMGDGTYGMDLTYRDESVASVYVKVDSDKNLNRNTKIYSLDISRVDNQIFTINNIDCNSDIEDVKNYMKNFNVNYDDNNKAVSIECTGESNKFFLFFNEEDDLVNSLYIEKGGNE